MFLTSFNVYFVLGYACCMCKCLKTAIWLFWDKICFFSEDRFATLVNRRVKATHDSRKAGGSEEYVLMRSVSEAQPE